MTSRRSLLLALTALAATAVLLWGYWETESVRPARNVIPAASPRTPTLSARARRRPASTPEQAPARSAKAAPPSTGEEVPGGLIAGRVLNAYGDPMSGIPVRVVGGGRGFTEDGGAFTIQVPGPGVYTVRAYVGGLFQGTATQQVTVGPGGSAINVKLRFPAEGSIRGRALLPDGEPAAQVLLKITTDSNDMGLGSLAEAIWSLTQARSWLACRTDEHGRFGFGAIHPRSTYTLWWMGDDGRPLRRPETVHAGQTNIHVEIPRHRLTIEVYDAETGKTIDCDAWHFIDPDARDLPESDLDTPLNHGSDWDEHMFVAPAGHRVRALALSWGYELADTSYTMKDIWGTQVVRVKVRRLPSDGAQLYLEARDPEGRVVKDMRFLRMYIDAAGAEVMDVGLYLIGASEEFELRVPPCRLRIRTAGREVFSGWNDPALLLLEASRTIDVPRSGEVRVQLDMTLGGAAVLDFKPPKNPGHYRGRYLLHGELRNEQGQVVPVGWSPLRYPPGTPGEVLGTGGPVRSTALPAGRYRLKLYEDFESIFLQPVTVPIEIRAGRLTQVPVQLLQESEPDK